MTIQLEVWTDDQLHERKERLLSELRVHEYLDIPGALDLGTLRTYAEAGMLDYDDLERYDELDGIQFLLGER